MEMLIFQHFAIEFDQFESKSIKLKIVCRNIENRVLFLKKGVSRDMRLFLKILKKKKRFYYASFYWQRKQHLSIYCHFKDICRKK